MRTPHTHNIHPQKAALGIGLLAIDLLVGCLATAQGVSESSTTPLTGAKSEPVPSVDPAPKTSYAPGTWPIRNYTQKEYGDIEQTWAIAQDEYGLIYLGGAGQVQDIGRLRAVFPARVLPPCQRDACRASIRRVRLRKEGSAAGAAASGIGRASGDFPGPREDRGTRASCAFQRKSSRRRIRATANSDTPAVHNPDICTLLLQTGRR